MLIFKDVHVKGVTSNVAKGTILLTFTVTKTDEAMQTAESLAFFVDKGQLTLMVENKQMSFSVAQDDKKGE